MLLWGLGLGLGLGLGFGVWGLGELEVRDHSQPVILSEAEGSPCCMPPTSEKSIEIQKFSADCRRSLHYGRDDSAGGRDDSLGGRAVGVVTTTEATVGIAAHTLSS